MLALQLGMFWVGMDICPHSCLIKEKKKQKREKDFNVIFFTVTFLNFFITGHSSVLTPGTMLTPRDTGRKDFVAGYCCPQVL